MDTYLPHSPNARSLPFNRHEKRNQERLARPPSCHRKRHRNAAYRAISGARLMIKGAISTKQEAARICASTPQYIAAALIVLQAEGPQLTARVLKGEICLLAAAVGVKQRADLLTAYRAATPADRIAVSEIVGPRLVPDEPAGRAVDGDGDGEEEEESVEDLITEARASGDVASYLQRNGLTTLGDVVENS